MVALIITTLVTLVVFRMKPVYRATARMEIQAETSQLLTLNDINPGWYSDDVYLQTQVNLLQNNNLIWETIEQLGLAAGKGGSGSPAGLSLQFKQT